MKYFSNIITTGRDAVKTEQRDNSNKLSWNFYPQQRGDRQDMQLSNLTGPATLCFAILDDWVSEQLVWSQGIQLKLRGCEK